MGEMVLGAKRLECGGEMTKSENRGETILGETSWGRNNFLSLVKTVTDQFAPLRFDPWSTRTLIFHTIIYPSQLTLHTVSLLGQLAP